jgi:hypothetical protein
MKIDERFLHPAKLGDCLDDSPTVMVGKQTKKLTFLSTYQIFKKTGITERVNESYPINQLTDNKMIQPQTW